MTRLPDVYFSEQYGKLYETIENGECEMFVFSNAFGAVQNVFIKRAIPDRVDGVTYYDTISPYGYGGPVVVETTDRQKLLEGYEQAWKAYCDQERIVSEFVRFHPLVRNDVDFGSMYDAVFDRHTVAIELTDGFEMSQLTSKCRNRVNRAKRVGVSCWVDENCETIDAFRELYYQTMTKDHASDYYFFSAEYFRSMRETLKGQLFLVNAELEGRIIASSLMMMSDEFVHYHLSATDPAFYSCSANNLILWHTADYGLQKGKTWFHLGGGLSSSPEDDLFKFKRAFAHNENNLKEFWIGRAIRNEAVYGKLVDIQRQENGFDDTTRFFPKYRSRV